MLSKEFIIMELRTRKDVFYNYNRKYTKSKTAGKIVRRRKTEPVGSPARIRTRRSTQPANYVDRLDRRTPTPTFDFGGTDAIDENDVCQDCSNAMEQLFDEKKDEMTKHYQEQIDTNAASIRREEKEIKDIVKDLADFDKTKRQCFVQFDLNH